jgi:hypothetical protein
MNYKINKSADIFKGRLRQDISDMSAGCKHCNIHLKNRKHLEKLPASKY